VANLPREYFLSEERSIARWENICFLGYDLRFFVKQQNLSERWAELNNAFQAEFRDYVTGLINENALNNIKPTTK
jgi:hypothetical protein